MFYTSKLRVLVIKVHLMSGLSSSGTGSAQRQYKIHQVARGQKQLSAEPLPNVVGFVYQPSSHVTTIVWGCGVCISIPESFAACHNWLKQ